VSPRVGKRRDSGGETVLLGNATNQMFVLYLSLSSDHSLHLSLSLARHDLNAQSSIFATGLALALVISSLSTGGGYYLFRHSTTSRRGVAIKTRRPSVRARCHPYCNQTPSFSENDRSKSKSASTSCWAEAPSTLRRYG
jgi:hypothetical protein